VSLGPVVSKPQEQVILGHIERARAAGLPLLAGGAKLTGPDYDNGYFIQPTIFDEVPPDSQLAQQEVFGPVLAVISFQTEEEAIAIANGTPYGLTSAIWTGNHPRAMRVAARVRAGTIWLNDTYQQNSEGIWGGYKMSGIGRELGPHGIADFTEIKEVFTDGTGLTMKPHYRQVLDD
jgi:betaine-aldehyde dehydrogenase